MVRSNIKAEKFLCYRNREHGKAYAEPSDLGETDHCTGKPASLLSEAPLRKHVEGESALGPYESERTGVSSKDKTTKDKGPYEAPEIQACGELLPDPHAGTEEGEAKHHHEHTEGALAPCAVYRTFGVVRIETLFTHIYRIFV